MAFDTSRPGTTQTVAYDASVACTNAFSSQTRSIRVSADSACHIKVGGTPTATTSDPLLPANWAEYIAVNPGEKIAAIKAATNGTIITATAGTLWVTELS